MDTIQTSLPHLTPSSLNDLECPKKYETLQIRKQWQSREPTAAVANGTAIHAVLRELYHNR